MNPRYKLIIFVLLLAIFGIVFLVFKYKENLPKDDFKNTTILPTATTTTQINSTTTNEIVSTTTTALQSTNELFSKSSDYANAYLIYPTINKTAKKSISNFNLVTKDLGNENFEITLTSKTQSDLTQSITITKNQKVYFIEKSPVDDTVTEDKNISDDFLVAVDEKGFILK
ncbi:MAG: hypothetical protein WCF92_00065 [bacterium]